MRRVRIYFPVKERMHRFNSTSSCNRCIASTLHRIPDSEASQFAPASPLNKLLKVQLNGTIVMPMWVVEPVDRLTKPAEHNQAATKAIFFSGDTYPRQFTISPSSSPISK